MAVEGAGKRSGRWRAEAVAGAVGAGLGLSLVGLTLVPWGRFDPLGCRQEGGFACLGYLYLLVLSLPPLTVLLGWLALRLAGVRPAWRVALAGAVLLGVAAWWLRALGLLGDLLWVLPVPAGALYALAAWLVLPAPGGRRRRRPPGAGHSSRRTDRAAA